ncbi:hypothetical protein K2X05_05865 [bacterium]|nr:hypothetical protein [bacterium]
MKTMILLTSLFLTYVSSAAGLPEKSDVMSVLKYQTSVKNQGQRSLCTVFSFTALLESLVLKKYPQFKPKDVNFSEQWVQYLVALQSPSGGGNGAKLEDIFKQVKKYGISEEKYLSYDGTLWSEKGPNLAIERCGSIKNILSQKRCYSSHFSPDLIQLSDTQLRDMGYDDFANAVQSAQQNFDIIGNLRSDVVSMSEAKRILSNGTPVALKVRVYYGSWNHARGDKYGIDRDPSLYQKGVVTYPEAGSVDYIESSKEANLAIHSVLLVGYDDTVVVNYKKLMKDGTTKEFSRRGVFYFKNSWDLRKFGSQFKIGKQKLQGYGMIVQDHAALGQFFVLSI